MPDDAETASEGRTGGSGDARRSLLVRELVVAERDRRRVAGDIHDGPQQLLLSAGIRLNLLIAESSGALHDGLAEIGRQLIAAEHELRVAASELDTLLQRSRLTDAVRAMTEADASRTGWTVEFHAEGFDDRLPETVVLVVAHSAREALDNARRHAEADHVAVELRRTRDRVVLSVTDDGIGFAPSASGGGAHIGLRTIRERASILGGSARIDGRPGEGTRVVVEIPVAGAQDGETSSPSGSSSTNTDPTGSPAR